MKNYKLLIIFAVFLVSFAFTSAVFAKNDCDNNGCEITITMNFAFTGASDELIERFVDDIEGVWNHGDPTTGACKCKVEFEVNTTTVDECPATGYHCVEVSTGMARDNNGREHVAFMWGTSRNGNSVNGRWGGRTNAEIPSRGISFGGETYIPSAGERYRYAAHEAGHAMGLPDEYDQARGTFANNIMGRVWGPTAVPTQDHIDKIVEINCPLQKGKCPNECCCGNESRDTSLDPPEECEYTLTPDGCAENQTCNEDCICEADDQTDEEEDECGNEQVDEGEVCDQSADENGCEEGETCNSECTECINDAEDASCGDGDCATDEDCSTCVEDCSCDGGYSCLDATCVENECSEDSDCTGEEACMSYDCVEGFCESAVIASCKDDDDCCPLGCNNNTDNDCVAECGNDVCEGAFEDCLECTDDCGCTSGMSCDPFGYSADASGCVVSGPVCGDGTCTGEEDCETCGDDCGCLTDYLCDPGHKLADTDGCYAIPDPVCGDGTCDTSEGEQCLTCEADCGCVPPAECAPGVPKSDSQGCL